MMRPLRLVMVVAFLCAALFLSADSASACDCHDGGPVCEAFFRSPVVFVGRVVEVTPLETTEQNGPRVKTRFRVTEPLRGTTAQSIELFGYGTSCDLWFEVGQDWIIYAGPRGDGAGLVTSTCSRSRPLHDAAPDLKFARSAHSRSSDKGLIYGQLLYRASPNFLPVPGVRVTLNGPWFEPLHAVTDRDGNYQVSAPPATYRISAALPAGMTFPSDHYLVALLDGRGCASADLVADYPGRLSGRAVTSSGQPIPNATVELIRVDGFDWVGYRLRGFTDARGRYSVSGLEPGSYTAAVTIGLVRTGTGVEPQYLFAGNTTAKAAAQRVQVKRGSSQTIDLALPASVRLAQVRGLVVRADGRPVPDAQVRMKADDDEPSLPWTTIRTDQHGRFSFALMIGTRYRIYADGVKPFQPRAKATVVDPAAPPKNLRLVIP